MAPEEPSDPLGAFAALLAGATQAQPRGRELLVVAAHPDDETLWIGGLLARLRETTIVHVSDGAPRNGRDARANGFATPVEYGHARRRELEAAVGLGGVPPGALIELGFPDGEAAKSIAAVARALLPALRAKRPRLVLTHPFEGGHPDHDATSLAVWAACRLAESAGETAPMVIEAPSYHLGPGGAVWGDFPEGDAVLTLPLGMEERACKERMLACFRTQAQVVAAFPVEVERFRAAPRYDFGSLPNGGKLLYESLGLDFSGTDWLPLADRALRELGLENR